MKKVSRTGAWSKFCSENFRAIKQADPEKSFKQIMGEVAHLWMDMDPIEKVSWTVLFRIGALCSFGWELQCQLVTPRSIDIKVIFRCFFSLGRTNVFAFI